MVLILGPQEPYELLNLAMAKIAVKGKLCFAPEPPFIDNESKMRDSIANAEAVVDVILDDAPNTSLEKYVTIAKEMNKPISTMYFASKSFDRKHGRMRGLTFLRFVGSI